MSKPHTIELLAPARNADFGIEAVISRRRCRVYRRPGIHRAGRGNQHLPDIERLCRYAHLFHARVYIALNTVLFEQELEEARRLVHHLHEAEPNALIVQDMALTMLDLPP
jgi:putative protease